MQKPSSYDPIGKRKVRITLFASKRNILVFLTLCLHTALSPSEALFTRIYSIILVSRVYTVFTHNFFWNLILTYVIGWTVWKSPGKPGNQIRLSSPSLYWPLTTRLDRLYEILSCTDLLESIAYKQKLKTASNLLATLYKKTR